MKFKTILASIGARSIKHAPALSVGCGVAALITGTIMAVKATTKAVKIIDAENSKSEEPLTKKEVVKKVWKCYIPTAIFTVSGSALVFVGLSKSLTRTASAIAASQLTEQAFNEYKAIVDKNTSDDDKKRIAEALVDTNKPTTIVTSSNDVPHLGGEQLCRDNFTGRFFYSSAAYLDKCIETFNASLGAFDDYSTMNDIYDIIGIDQCESGYFVRYSACKSAATIEYRPKITENNVPYLNVIIGGMIAPRY